MDRRFFRVTGCHLHPLQSWWYTCSWRHTFLSLFYWQAHRQTAFLVIMVFSKICNNFQWNDIFCRLATYVVASFCLVEVVERFPRDTKETRSLVDQKRARDKKELGQLRVHESSWDRVTMVRPAASRNAVDNKQLTAATSQIYERFIVTLFIVQRSKYIKPLVRGRVQQ